MQRQLFSQRLKKLGHRNPAQRRLRYLQRAGHGVGSEIIQRRRPLPVGHTGNIAARGTSRQHRPCQRQRRVPLAAGRNRQPLVGVGRRQRIPRVKVIMTPPVPRVFPGAKLAVPHCVGRRTAPGGQKITAETDQRIGVGNVVVRQPVAPQNIRHCAAIARVIHRRKRQPPPPECLRKPVGDPREPGVARLRNQQHPLPPVVQRRIKAVPRLIPANRPEPPRPPRPVPQHRPPNPVGMIQRLQNGVRRRRLLPLIRGETRIPPRLLRPSLHHPHQQPFPAGHRSVISGVPVVPPPHQILGYRRRALHPQLIVKQVAGYRPRSGDASPGQKFATAYLHHQRAPYLRVRPASL